MINRKPIIRTDKWNLNPNPEQRLLLGQTVKVYRRLCRYLVGIIFTHWTELGGLSSQQVIPAVERLVHQTTQNPDATYSSIDRVFHKFPSYYRRAAIAFAVGQVSSFVTRYQEWQSGIRRRRDAKPPTLNPDAGCYPVLYKGQCYKLYEFNRVEIKVFTGTDWVWTTVQISGLRERHTVHSNKPLSPSLIFNNKACHLSVPFECHPEKLQPNQNVVAVDLGINTTATVSVVNFDGTVIHREFIHPGRDSATCTGRFSMGSLLPWKFHIFHPHVKGSTESGHDRVGNETVGMQTTKVAETSSLSWSGARGKSPTVNVSELSNKLRDPGKSQIRLTGSSQKASGWDLQLVSL